MPKFSNIPATMKAWQFDEYETSGDIENVFSAMKLRSNVPTPVDIQDDDVLVKVQYANVNPIDWKIATGGFHAVLPISKFPFTPGLDIGGTIVKVGKTAALNWKVGDAVIADIGVAETTTVPPPSPGGSMGGFAEYAVVKADFCAKVPEDKLSTLTGLPVSAVTAYQALFTGVNKGYAGEELGKIKDGSKVLILAGSGGVGTNAIQLAKKLVKNCFVATTTSNNVELCKDLGADQVINYKKEDWGDVLAGQEFDLILDGVGLMEDLTERAPKVLKKGGDFVSIIQFDPSAREKCNDNVRFALFMIKSNGKELQTVADMAVKGDLDVLVDSEYSFKELPAAFRKNSTVRAVGKIIIKVDDS